MQNTVRPLSAIQQLRALGRATALSLTAAALLWSSLPAQAQTAQKAQPPAATVATPTADANCPQIAPTTPEQLAALSQQNHPDRGVLWELHKGEQRAYLLGTIHLGKPEWIFPGPITHQAISNAPAIALELDPLDANNTRVLSQYMMQDSDVQKLILRNNPQINQRLEHLASTLCVASPQFSQLGSIGKTLTLVMMDSVKAGYSMLFGVDLMLAATAQKTNKPVLALETVQEQIKAMGLGSNKLADSATPADFDKALGDIESGKNRDMLQQLATHWQQGDLAALDEMMRTCNCMDDIGTKTALLDERNARMAERIPAMLNKYPNLLIAVGLLHMVGENNLLQMLEKQGFSVQQLTGVGAVAQ